MNISLKEQILRTTWPYNLRGFWNKNRAILFHSPELFTTFVTRIAYLKDVYRDSALERGSLEELELDIEVDVETKNIPPIKKEKGTVYEEVTDRTKVKRLSNGSVELIPKRVSRDFLREVEREAYCIAMESCKSRVEMSRFLGVSIRTVTKKVKEYFDQSIT